MKRSNGEGTIYYNEKRERWEAQATFRDENGKAKRKLFVGKTQKEVNQKRIKWQKEVDGGLSPIAHKILVENWINRWLEEFVKPSVKIKTYEKYKSSMKYVDKHFGKMLITKISAIDVQKFLNNLLIHGSKDGSKLSTSTVRAVRRYMIACFEKAYQLGIVTKNIIRLSEPPKLEKEEIHPLTEEQVVKLLRVAKDGEYIYVNIKQRQKPSIDTQYLQALAYMAILLTVNTGMRYGEVFGLKWVDIDFIRHLINVKRSLSSTATKGLILETPKTKGSRRQIPITKNLIQAIEKFRAEQNHYAELLGDVFNNTENLVFPNSFGKPLHPSNFTRRFFKKILRKAEIDQGFCFHDMRHTHATLLLQRGVNIKIISERLGHSSITITLDTYSHVMPNMQEAAVKVLNEMNMIVNPTQDK